MPHITRYGEGEAEGERPEAAISSFGTVRAVVRAHHARRGRAAAAFVDVVTAIWLLVGTALTSIFAVGLVIVVVIVASGPGPHHVRLDAAQPSPGQLATFVVACGLLAWPCSGVIPGRAASWSAASVAGEPGEGYRLDSRLGRLHITNECAPLGGGEVQDRALYVL
jgi:hypothetical protein